MGAVQATSLLAKTGADVLIHINAKFSPQIPSYGRIKGFSDICEEYQIPHELMLTATGSSYEASSQILKDLLETIDSKYQGKTKGIFLPNDTFANISTVGQQIDRIAASAMEILHEQITERHKRKPALSSEPVHKIIPPILIKRETT